MKESNDKIESNLKEINIDKIIEMINKKNNEKNNEKINQV